MIGAVVLNYRTAADTIRTVEELHSQGVNPVVVVDNASGSDDRAALDSAARMPHRFLLLQSETNLGYSGGNNLGLRLLAELGCDVALVCNPDVHFPPDVLQQLYAAMRPQDVLVSPVLRSASGKVDSNGGWWAYRWGRGELNTRHVRPSRRSGRLATFNGACFMVDLKRFMDLGLLPEDHFLYGEEADVVRRLDARGWHWRQTDVEVVHDRGGSAGSSPNWSERSSIAHRYAAESAVLLTRKYWARWLPVVLAARIALAAVQLIRGDRQAARAIGGGIISGLKQRRNCRLVGD